MKLLNKLLFLSSLGAGEMVILAIVGVGAIVGIVLLVTKKNN